MELRDTLMFGYNGSPSSSQGRVAPPVPAGQLRRAILAAAGQFQRANVAHTSLSFHYSTNDSSATVEESMGGNSANERGMESAAASAAGGGGAAPAAASSSRVRRRLVLITGHCSCEDFVSQNDSSIRRSPRKKKPRSVSSPAPHQAQELPDAQLERRWRELLVELFASGKRGGVNVSNLLTSLRVASQWFYVHHADDNAHQTSHPTLAVAATEFLQKCLQQVAGFKPSRPYYRPNPEVAQHQTQSSMLLPAEFPAPRVHIHHVASARSSSDGGGGPCESSGQFLLHPLLATANLTDNIFDLSASCLHDGDGGNDAVNLPSAARSVPRPPLSLATIQGHHRRLAVVPVGLIKPALLPPITDNAAHSFGCVGAPNDHAGFHFLCSSLSETGAALLVCVAPAAQPVPSSSKRGNKALKNAKKNGGELNESSSSSSSSSVVGGIAFLRPVTTRSALLTPVPRSWCHGAQGPAVDWLERICSQTLKKAHSAGAPKSSSAVIWLSAKPPSDSLRPTSAHGVHSESVSSAELVPHRTIRHLSYLEYTITPPSTSTSTLTSTSTSTANLTTTTPAARRSNRKLQSSSSSLLSSGELDLKSSSSMEQAAAPSQLPPPRTATVDDAARTTARAPALSIATCSNEKELKERCVAMFSFLCSPTAPRDLFVPLRTLLQDLDTVRNSIAAMTQFSPSMLLFRLFACSVVKCRRLLSRQTINTGPLIHLLKFQACLRLFIVERMENESSSSSSSSLSLSSSSINNNSSNNTTTPSSKGSKKRKLQQPNAIPTGPQKATLLSEALTLLSLLAPLLDLSVSSSTMTVPTTTTPTTTNNSSTTNNDNNNNNNNSKMTTLGSSSVTSFPDWLRLVVSQQARLSSETGAQIYRFFEVTSDDNSLLASPPPLSSNFKPPTSTSTLLSTPTTKTTAPIAGQASSNSNSSKFQSPTRKRRLSIEQSAPYVQNIQSPTRRRSLRDALARTHVRRAQKYREEQAKKEKEQAKAAAKRRKTNAAAAAAATSTSSVSGSSSVQQRQGQFSRAMARLTERPRSLTHFIQGISSLSRRKVVSFPSVSTNKKSS